MKVAADIIALIEGQPDMMRLLHVVERLALPDCWIGAGFVRNAVWDVLHDRTPDCTRLNDVDVVFFDGADASRRRDDAIEGKLRLTCPGVPWSVSNQARMHAHNNDDPYADVGSAIARWPETATAVAARSVLGRVELLAPHGIDDLINLIVRPTTAFAARRYVVDERLRTKEWLNRWPQLTVV
ncbi:nucleotidyltransferase family protein [Bradyrhizobium prioriisuperbiae]|uniref:nucleotidyltransferase family protein n=1 Tax=Bradyrhizobium prioriisuperbiae TaxID=2854389 RepID=UPI0028E6C3E0|nr:nucleotidyltransferase family protein [Bradyrhizobium prioritasuperba]